MQSVANEAPEKEELRRNVAAQVKSLLGKWSQSVRTQWREYHQGSQATSDPALMNELMPALRA